MFTRFRQLTETPALSVGQIGSGVVAGVQGCARTIADGAAGLQGTVSAVGLSVLEAADMKRAAAVEAVEDAVWAVQRPIVKTGAVGAGMILHVVPIVLSRGLDKLADRLFGSIWTGPLAPIGLVLGAIDTYEEIVGVINEFDRLLRDADGRLDAAERRRLEVRRQEVEDRLRRWRPSQDDAILASGTASLAVIVGSSGGAGRFDVSVLVGEHAGKVLSELTPEQVRGLWDQAPDPETKRIIEAWLRVAAGGGLNRAA